MKNQRRGMYKAPDPRWIPYMGEGGRGAFYIGSQVSRLPRFLYSCKYQPAILITLFLRCRYDVLLLVAVICCCIFFTGTAAVVV